jgi:hypothetical protein
MPAATDPAPAGLRHPWVGLAVALAATAVALLLWQVDPTQAGNPLPPCPSEWLTGLFCPGCGSTRALHALLHGNVAAAMSFNPLLVLALPFIALLLAHQVFVLPAGLQAFARRIGDARPWAVLVIAYMLLRNLPWEPFAALAPG